mmetsp:Transcript_1061/g.1506  ORF Transcript_1061/g.1506 Transcript_1061/m.1506 type:complete len:226 (-) Transcript_1061:493-1170(-)|eukprot:CAMPEP_0185728382 /NCGR_PEP_ID=MMETSP1171-20130828/3743_1 /TAXON_ID=374046 /ORGANISM="Helicotheca tamensis, Strain CCMP826" /LENGTH=225 /DNA_ID=CAMNT_0028397089 /DNA_START=172 /DNA_END=849 /DNA_ORIENTATION=+
MKMFGKPKKTQKEIAKEAQRQTKRDVRQSQREIDREIRELERNEKQVMMEIKKRAKQPGVNGKNDPALKALAKQLVQIRNQKNKMFEAKAQLSTVGMQATGMASQVAAAQAVGSVTSAMASANSALDAKEMQKIMTEFQRQNEIATVKEEMMDDALADAFDSEEVDNEADQVTAQVLEELGVELDSQMVGLSAPGKKPVVEEVNAEEEAALNEALPDLKARLDAL